MKIDGELSNSFRVGVRVRQGCVMSPWLFNVFMDGCIREMKAKVGKLGARLKLNGVDWAVAACLQMTLCYWQRAKVNSRE